MASRQSRRDFQLVAPLPPPIKPSSSNSQSKRRPNNQSNNQSLNLSVKQPNPSVKQSHSQSSKRSPDHSTKRPSSQSAKQSSSQSVKQSNNQSNNQTTDQPLKPFIVFCKLIGPRNQIYYVDKPRFTLGRRTSISQIATSSPAQYADDSYVRCADYFVSNQPSVSKIHCLIEWSPQQSNFTVTCYSKNGMLIDGQYLEQSIDKTLDPSINPSISQTTKVPLHSGALLSLGDEHWYFVQPDRSHYQTISRPLLPPFIDQSHYASVLRVLRHRLIQQEENEQKLHVTLSQQRNPSINQSINQSMASHDNSPVHEPVKQLFVPTTTQPISVSNNPSAKSPKRLVQTMHEVNFLPMWAPPSVFGRLDDHQTKLEIQACRDAVLMFGCPAVHHSNHPLNTHASELSLDDIIDASNRERWEKICEKVNQVMNDDDGAVRSSHKSRASHLPTKQTVNYSIADVQALVRDFITALTDSLPPRSQSIAPLKDLINQAGSPSNQSNSETRLATFCEWGQLMKNVEAWSRRVLQIDQLYYLVSRAFYQSIDLADFFETHRPKGRVPAVWWNEQRPGSGVINHDRDLLIGFAVHGHSNFDAMKTDPDLGFLGTLKLVNRTSDQAASDKSSRRNTTEMSDEEDHSDEDDNDDQSIKQSNKRSSTGQVSRGKANDGWPISLALVGRFRQLLKILSDHFSKPAQNQPSKPSASKSSTKKSSSKSKRKRESLDHAEEYMPKKPKKQPKNRALNLSVDQSIDQPIDQSNDRDTTDFRPAQPIRQSPSPNNTVSINQSINQSNDQFSDEDEYFDNEYDNEDYGSDEEEALFDQPNNQSINQSDDEDEKI